MHSYRNAPLHRERPSAWEHARPVAANGACGKVDRRSIVRPRGRRGGFRRLCRRPHRARPRRERRAGRSGPLGGLCILRGCMPSKTLDRLERPRAGFARHASSASTRAAGGRFAGVMARKREIIEGFADYRIEGINDFPLYRGARVSSPATNWRSARVMLRAERSSSHRQRDRDRRRPGPRGGGLHRQRRRARLERPPNR